MAPRRDRGHALLVVADLCSAKDRDNLFALWFYDRAFVNDYWFINGVLDMMQTP